MQTVHVDAMDVPAKKRQRLCDGNNDELQYPPLPVEPNYYAALLSFSSKLTKDELVKDSPFNKKEFISQLKLRQYQDLKLGSIHIGKDNRNGGGNNLHFSGNSRICPRNIISILKSINYNVPSISVCVASNNDEEKRCKCGDSGKIDNNSIKLGDCKALSVGKLHSAQIPLSSLNVFINNDDLALRIMNRSTTTQNLAKYPQKKEVECYLDFALLSWLSQKCLQSDSAILHFVLHFAL